MSKKKNIINTNNTSPLNLNEKALFNDTIFDNNIEQSQTTYSVKTCKVLDILSKNKVMIDFDGFGIIVSVSNVRIQNIDIKYTGTIGKPNFKYEVI